MRFLLANLVILTALLGTGLHEKALASDSFVGKHVTVPAEGGLIFQMKVNGRGPYKTVFDTGAVNVMSATFARDLGLRIDEKAADFGAIGGSVKARTVHVDTLAIGELNIVNQTFYVLDIPSESDTPQMLVGWEFMQMFAVEMNVKRNEITFFEGTGFATRAKARQCRSSCTKMATGSMSRQRSEVSGVASLSTPGIKPEPF